ncbi:MAG: ATP-binding protein [Gemmatimonadales bacterium]|nr:MAG: ATP-binding protein [Gemmatimonadales bacterium]
MNDIKTRLLSALSRVRSAADGPDVVSAGIVRDVTVDSGTAVVMIAPSLNDAPAVIESIRLVASGVSGIEQVRFALVDSTVNTPADSPTGPAPREPRSGRRSLPVIEPEVRKAAPPPPPRSANQVTREEASRHPRDAEPLAGVRHVVAVSSGKGGVGKSTISTNLAAAWAAAGYKVGLMDADIYGPDIPTMFGAYEKPRMKDDRVIPVEAHGVKLMSLGFLVGEETPAVWRGPIVMGIVRQFLHQVDWGELDYLIVDLPPGTGDAQLSLVQLVKVTGAVMVATPQDVAVTGALKGIKMFESVDVPVIGIVENMRGFVCPDCNSVHDVFGSGGAETLAGSLGIPFLGAVPMGMAVREEGDRGEPTVIGRSDSAEGRALQAIAEAVADRIDQLAGQPTAT